MAEQKTSPAVRRVLVVDDEALICLLVESILEDSGYAVLSASSVAEALSQIDLSAPDACILDLNLNGEKIFPVAECLTLKGIPFVFATGGSGHDTGVYSDRPCIGKPFRDSDLLEAVAALLR